MVRVLGVDLRFLLLLLRMLLHVTSLLRVASCHYYAKLSLPRWPLLMTWCLCWGVFIAPPRSLLDVVPSLPGISWGTV